MSSILTLGSQKERKKGVGHWWSSRSPPPSFLQAKIAPLSLYVQLSMRNFIWGWKNVEEIEVIGGGLMWKSGERRKKTKERKRVKNGRMKEKLRESRFYPRRHLLGGGFRAPRRLLGWQHFNFVCPSPRRCIWAPGQWFLSQKFSQLSYNCSINFKAPRGNF